MFTIYISTFYREAMRIREGHGGEPEEMVVKP
jgi:hypothetical protein